MEISANFAFLKQEFPFVAESASYAERHVYADPSFLVPKAEIAENDYDLSINRYKEVEYEAVDYDPPKVILARLAELEEEIARGRGELEGMLG